jgi:DNA-binding transcriptional ArsR family regulator
MSSRTATGTVRAALAEVAKALAHEHRVELIEQLAQGPRNVEALAERAGLSLANASQHLQQLRVAGLVTSRREGKRVVYRLADEVERDIVSLLGALRHVAEQAVASMERIVTAERPILYYVFSISYDIISKFWPIWSAGPRAAARHFALRRGGRLFLRVGCVTHTDHAIDIDNGLGWTIIVVAAGHRHYGGVVTLRRRCLHFVPACDRAGSAPLNSTHQR